MSHLNQLQLPQGERIAGKPMTKCEFNEGIAALNHCLLELFNTLKLESWRTYDIAKFLEFDDMSDFKRKKVREVFLTTDYLLYKSERVFYTESQSLYPDIQLVSDEDMEYNLNVFKKVTCVMENLKKNLENMLQVIIELRDDFMKTVIDVEEERENE